MRPVVVALMVLLVGCTGTASPAPVESTTPTTPATTSAHAPHPPLAADLTGGTPLQLGSVGHWAIADGSAFIATDEGIVGAVDLATGSVRWRVSFELGEPWDAQPTLGLSTDRATVIAARTVDAENAPALDLLLLDAGSGATLAEHLVTDPAGRWSIDLPPHVLAADHDTAVLADNPEWGRQTVVVKATDGTLAWRVDDQAVAATPDIVVTRGGGWSRSDGAQLWRTAAPVGSRLAQSPDALVVLRESAAVWLDPATGAEFSRTPGLGEAEPPCAATLDTLVCLGSDVAGYDLRTGRRVWTSPSSADSVITMADWAYLWRAGGHGDVVDARTGDVLVTDAELPAIRYSDGTGVLLSTDTGYRWVPYAR